MFAMTYSSKYIHLLVCGSYRVLIELVLLVGVAFLSHRMFLICS